MIHDSMIVVHDFIAAHMRSVRFHIFIRTAAFWSHFVTVAGKENWNKLFLRSCFLLKPSNGCKCPCSCSSLPRSCLGHWLYCGEHFSFGGQRDKVTPLRFWFCDENCPGQPEGLVGATAAKAVSCGVWPATSLSAPGRGWSCFSAAFLLFLKNPFASVSYQIPQHLLFSSFFLRKPTKFTGLVFDHFLSRWGNDVCCCLRGMCYIPPLCLGCKLLG